MSMSMSNALVLTLSVTAVVATPLSASLVSWVVSPQPPSAICISARRMHTAMNGSAYLPRILALKNGSASISPTFTHASYVYTYAPSVVGVLLGAAMYCIPFIGRE
ncbi:hypothetical protein HD806DRAFT_531229 [Xylariaceae sp. AK1471]|nr:hypothetical protein HD806DRAFT_531229 [Xylariaceae sp. AK1471]